MQMHSGATDKDFLEDLLVLIEDPDDGWYENRQEGEVELVHPHSRIKLRINSGGWVYLLIRTRRRGEEGRVLWQSWRPSGFRGIWYHYKLKKAVNNLRRHLLFAPIREALDGEVHEEEDDYDDDDTDEDITSDFLAELDKDSDDWLV